ncbi:MAG: metallophosphoesterase [Oscillospiraceae bacterium]
MKKAKHKSKRKIIILTAAVLLLAVVITDVILSNTWLTVRKYTLSCEKITEPLKIVQLSDLHNYTFGKDNKKLIEAVSEQSPDLIFMTGDMVNYDSENLKTASWLVKNLSELAPVYYSLGNHEEVNENNYGTDIESVMTEAGARVLDFTYDDIEVKGNMLRIGGLLGYCTPDIYDVSDKFKDDTVFMKDFQDTDRCKLLLCHMPASWLGDKTLNYWDVDFVFSGHVHGGQIRLPFIGGVYGPDLGFFPGKVCGVYDSDDKKSHLILTAGLGGHTIPRVNNLPEIVSLEIFPQN